MLKAQIVFPLLLLVIAQVLGDTQSRARVPLSTVSGNSCTLEAVPGVLNIKHFQAPGKLLFEKLLDSKRSCRELCCDLVTCNSYVWHKTGHCFLLYCAKGNKCDIVQNDNAETGFVYQSDRSTGRKGQSNPESGSIPLKRDNQDETQGEISDLPKDKMLQRVEPVQSVQQLHLGPSNEEMNTKIASIRVKNIQRNKPMGRTAIQSDAGERTHQNSEVLKVQDDDENSKREPGATSAKGISQGSKSTNMHTTTSTSLVGTQHPTKASHTTTTSLIAALCFGLIFLLAVVFLIGKRWYENMAGSGKGGYSRVSFLMNGM